MMFVFGRNKKIVVVLCSAHTLTYIFRIRQIKILCKSKCNFHFRSTLFYRCYFVLSFAWLLIFAASALRTMHNGIEIQSIRLFLLCAHRPNQLVVAFFDSISLYYIYILAAHG